METKSNLYQPPHKRKQLSDSRMNCLPSHVMNKKFIQMPVEEKVIDSDDKWSQCGKWVVFNDGPSVQDNLWKDLQCLLEDKQCIMIKASTRAMEDEGWVILCYTLPEESRIKQAAESIRNIKRNNKVIFYKRNTNIERGLKYCDYMYTPGGIFYEKDTLGRWILVDDMSEDENKRRVSVGTEKLRNLQISSTTTQHNISDDADPSNNSKLNYFTMICDVSEFNTTLEAVEKLRKQGVFQSVTLKDLYMKRRITCFISDFPDVKDTAEIIDVIRKNINYPYPLAIKKYKAEKKNYDICLFQTAEGEFCELRCNMYFNSNDK